MRHFMDYYYLYNQQQQADDLHRGNTRRVKEIITIQKSHTYWHIWGHANGHSVTGREVTLLLAQKVK